MSQMINTIELCHIEEIDGNYVTVKLAHTELLGVEEVMVLQMNLASSAYPEEGSDVLVAFDSVGDAYCIGVVTSDNQAPAGATEDNVVGAGDIKASFKASGKVTIENSVGELIASIKNLSDLVGQVTVVDTATKTILEGLDVIFAPISVEADLIPFGTPPAVGQFTVNSAIVDQFKE